VAKYIPHDGPIQRLDGTFSLTRLQQLVGGEIELVTLRTDDVLVVQKDSWFRLPHNMNASSLAGLKPPVYGNAVICTLEEIE
jgi:hypothetical protein